MLVLAYNTVIKEAGVIDATTSFEQITMLAASCFKATTNSSDTKKRKKPADNPGPTKQELLQPKTPLERCLWATGSKALCP
jgi:hypothetical protein